MAINRATLASDVDGYVQYIYPKTTADLVEYDNTTVDNKLRIIDNKLDIIDDTVNTFNNRMENIIENISDGSLSTSADAELIDIRTPNIDISNETYQSAGDSIRSQMGILNNKIIDIVENFKTGTFYDEIYVNGEPLVTSDNESINARITISDLIENTLNALTDMISLRIYESSLSALNAAKEYTDNKIDKIQNLDATFVEI